MERVHVCDETHDAKKLKCHCCYTPLCFSELHMAAIRGDVIAIAQLIEDGCDVNATVGYSGVAKGFTPLHLAADFKNADAVQILLESGADFTLEDDNNRTALHFACRKQAKDIVELIVKAYLTVCGRLNKPVRKAFAERNIPTDMGIEIRDEFWTTFKPLHFAVKFRLTEILMTLIECGVDVTKTDANGMNALHCLIAEYSGLIDEEMRDCRKVLHRVVKKFVKDRICPSTPDRIIGKLIRMFVSSSRDIKNSVDTFGRTPMFYLYEGLRYRKSHYYELTNQGDVRWLVNSSMQGWERVTMVRRLLRWPSVDMLARDSEGNTILHALAQVVFPYRHDDSVEEINFLIEEYLAAGGDIDAVNGAGLTPLLLNCRLANSEVAEALLSHGADLNAMNPDGDTPYSIARYIRRERSRQLWDNHSLVMFSYLKRLVILGAPLCGVNKEVYEDDSLEFQSAGDQFEARKRIVFPDESYRKELKRMRSESVDAYTTLYDVLWKNVRDMVHQASNARLYDSDFLKDYPIYGYLVRIKMDEARARAELHEPAREILRWIVNYDLPESCLNKILKYFQNEDLKDLRKVVEFKEVEDMEEEESIDR